MDETEARQRLVALLRRVALAIHDAPFGKPFSLLDSDAVTELGALTKAVGLKHPPFRIKRVGHFPQVGRTYKEYLNLYPPGRSSNACPLVSRLLYQRRVPRDGEDAPEWGELVDDGGPRRAEYRHALGDDDLQLLLGLLRQWESAFDPATVSSATAPTTPAPASRLDPDVWLTSSELAQKAGVNREALRKRLERWRTKNSTGWRENSDAPSKDARFIYQVKAVHHLLG